MPGADTAQSLDLVAHVIQVALTPVFLLSGIATLLNVFSTRLARVADRVEQLTAKIASAAPDEAGTLADQLKYLRRRSWALDAAVVLAAIAGAATCGTVLTLFLGKLREATTGSVLFSLFGLAVICTIGALVAYSAEMLMAGSGVRAEVARGHREVEDEKSSPRPIRDT